MKQLRNNLISINIFHNKFETKKVRVIEKEYS